MFKKMFAADDEEPEQQEQDMQQYLSLVPAGTAQDFTSVDVLPGSHGDFGLTATNPIPVNGPIGEAVYIFRLRGDTNVPFWYQRLGSMESELFSRRLDVYELLSTNGKEWAILYFSMRHMRRTTKAPSGFSLISWRKHKTPYGIAAKLGAFGTNTGPHEDFPYCLPRLIRSNPSLAQVDPKFPDIIARTIQSALNDIVITKRPYNLSALCKELNLVNWA